MYTSQETKWLMQQYNTSRPLLTTKEAVLLLNVHSNTIRRWSEQGILKSYRIGLGRRRRFKAEDIADLLIQQTENYQMDAGKLSRH
jgi:excisionase family DNA binding protein